MLLFKQVEEKKKKKKKKKRNGNNRTFSVSKKKIKNYIAQQVLIQEEQI